MVIQEGEKTRLIHKRFFIETDSFPVALVSQASAGEKTGGGRPGYWEIVFWWTRKPLASARAVIAGSMLPADVEPQQFLKACRLDQKTPHRYNPVIPNEWISFFQGKKLLDPFAGFGSIPLEALRLGMSPTAVELLPTAYVFLNAVLGYPVRYGERLMTDVKKWGNWVMKRLADDPILGGLYDNDVAVYVGSWQIKCPHCGIWTPLVGSSWLSRTKNAKGNYDSLVWLEFRKNGGEVITSVVDLKKEFKDLHSAIVAGDKVSIKDKSFTVIKSNLNPRSEQATCFGCGGQIRYVDPETGKHYLDKKKLDDEIAARVQWYVKYALVKFNGGDSSLADHRLLAKVRRSEKGLEFEACAEADNQKLVAAKREVERLAESGDPDVPNESISPYSVRYLFPLLYGLTEWSKLFNPRQLLALVKLVKLIREAGGQLEEEELRRGSPKEEANGYTAAVMTYLAVALADFACFNAVTTQWEATAWQKVKRVFAFRGIAMNWNYCDNNPHSTLLGSFRSSLENGVDGLQYLLDCGRSGGSLVPVKSPKSEVVKVLLDDATVLSKVDAKERFDVIVTDPPYYDDVPYTELSDFYYVWLKRCLSNISANKLVPRFIPEAFFKRISGRPIESKTQWEELASREVSLNPPRLGPSSTYDEGVKHFESLLDASFLTLSNLLTDEGVFVTYYAHTDPDAWKALLKSGWETAGLAVSNAFPLTTESSQSVVSRGKLSLDTSIVVVWRRKAMGSIQAADLYDRMTEASERRTLSAIGMKVRGRDLFVGALAAALSEATKYEEIIEMKKLETAELMDKYVLRGSLYGLARGISHQANVEEGTKTNEGMMYLVTKFLYAGSQKKIITSDDARIFSLGTGVDLSHVVNDLKIFRTGGDEEEGEGSSLAKRKTLVLLDPQSKDRSKLKDLMFYRGLDVENPTIRCSVDALHLLEYYALTQNRQTFLSTLSNLRTAFPSEIEESLGLARVISSSLPEDVEGALCAQLVGKMSGSTDLTGYLG